MVKRLKHLSINDLAYSLYFKESFDFLDSVDFNCLSAKDLAKLYCVAKYENDLELLSEQARQIVINHKEIIKKSRKKLVEYFGHLSDARFLLDVKEIKNEEALEEVNPVDEYLKNYKEQKLAEFCVQKDKEIENRKNERQKLMEQITDMKVTVKQHDETWKNMDSLYVKIKKLSVNDYLKLYHMMNNDIAGNYSTITTVLPSYVGINGNR